MRLLKHFYKTPFWSPLLLGIVAIFSLPAVSSSVESEQETVINQTVQSLSAYTDWQEVEQPYLFIAELKLQQPLPLQAVRFSESFANYYQCDIATNHPIRAGPLS